MTGGEGCLMETSVKNVSRESAQLQETGIMFSRTEPSGRNTHIDLCS